MPFDIILPCVVSTVTIAIVLLYEKFEAKMKLLFEEKEFRVRDAIFLVIGMGVIVTVMVVIPQQAIQILFLIAYSFVLFLFTYVALEKWYLAVLPSVVFVALYFSPFWGYELLNVFAIAFAILVSLYLAGLFSWTTVVVFAALITVMDVIQVLGTGFMGEAAGRFIELQLPVLIQVPMFPYGGFILLGLGDIFLGGLLAVQIMQKYDRKTGVLSALSIGFAFFVFEIALLYYRFARFFPATLVVVFGWLIAFGIVYAERLRTIGTVGGIACFLGALAIGFTMFEITLKSLVFSLILLSAEATIICILAIFGIAAFIKPYALQRLHKSKKPARTHEKQPKL